MCLCISVGDKGKPLSIAMDMMLNREQGKRLPILFYIRPGEAKPLPEIKALVSRMTAFDPRERPAMSRVHKKLDTLATERESKNLNINLKLQKMFYYNSLKLI